MGINGQWGKNKMCKLCRISRNFKPFVTSKQKKLPLVFVKPFFLWNFALAMHQRLFCFYLKSEITI